MFRTLAIISVLLSAAACSQPPREAPAVQVSAAVVTPAQQVQDVRAMVEPCAQAMDRASGHIGVLAADEIGRAHV